MSHKVLKKFVPVGANVGAVVQAGADYDGADSDLWIGRGYLVEPEGWVDPNPSARPALAVVESDGGDDDDDLTPEQAAVILAEYAEVKNRAELADFIGKFVLPVDTSQKVADQRDQVEALLEPIKALLPKEPEGDGPEGNGADGKGDGKGDDETTGDEAPAGDGGS